MILIVMGVAGAGKSTVGRAVADALSWDFLEGDELHSESSVAKIRAGRPLDDSDRWRWLDRIAIRMAELAAAGVSAVVACSALKRSYRDRLRTAATDVAFVFVRVSPDVAVQRLDSRRHHFATSSIAPAQFATLEEPSAGEHVLEIDGELPVASVVARVLSFVRRGADISMP